MLFRIRRGLAAVLLTFPLAACYDSDAVIAPERTIHVAGGVDRNAVTVYTRNVYLGAYLEDVPTLPTNQIPIAVAQVWANVQATDFAVRVQAIADEIAALRPQLVGLQEMSKWLTQTPSDWCSAT